MSQRGFKMNGDQKLYTVAWLCVTSWVIVGLLVLYHLYRQSEKDFIENGFTKVRVPSSYTTVWQKPEDVNLTKIVDLNK